MISEKLSSANFTPQPLFRLAICFAFGITAANFLSVDWRICLATILFSAISAIVFIKQKHAPVFLFVAFAALGAMYFQIENQAVSSNRLKNIFDEKRMESGDSMEIEGVLKEPPELSVGGFFLNLNAEKVYYKNTAANVSGTVRFFAAVPNAQIESEYEQLDLKYGSRIRVASALRRENSFLNAGAISQTEILDQKEIDAVGAIKSSLLVEKIGETKIFPPLAWIYDFRQKLTIDFRDNFNISTAGVLIASLLGNDNFLDRRTADVFRDGGTFHVLVISGLHITFIGGLLLILIRFFTKKRFWQFVLASLFLWSYAIAVGANVPVVRATLMFTVLLVSQVIYRNGTLINALGLCALILLAWRPNDIFSSSFQLTFASVGAIILIAFPLIEKLRAVGKWSPSVETPFPPRVPVWLKKFCEMIYWREEFGRSNLRADCGPQICSNRLI